ncbi:polysaccharide deacetylase family protein [Flavobacterium silvaticum]|uniref:Polysaccharide deacetylase n=1 Tax=Flavobacterium silvaticum TaxID=1852020 RepID=A0A972G136_9FLAO|nr:polysaccharide deacetylase [Flavobacterium silvaticum]NMH28506.1 polysaccharide deacetylase [Flavobacterium silvaticum]
MTFKTTISTILTLAVILFSARSISQNEGISNYKKYFAFTQTGTQKFLIIRQYQKAGKQFYIGVDFSDLSTRIFASDDIKTVPANWEKIQTDYKDTPYIQAINFTRQQSLNLQDSGISNGYPEEKGITLTIDLCPSGKPLDRIIFTSLINEFGKIEKPVPLALSITGKFMLSHPDDMQWLKNREASNDIRITWINHTYNHFYNPKLPLAENFLLKPGTDINFEILETEKALLERGLLFSVFFRFPGLVSDQSLIEKVTGYGLIPIGSDAWLAKGQTAHDGNIVLIHGNGNEPLGVKDFLKLLQDEKSAVTNKEWLLYDLRESVEDEFEK